jgi:hypothetical protein
MRVRCAVLSLSLVVAGSALRAQATVPGWTYAMNITFDSGTGAPNRGSIAIRYQTSGTAMRTEMVQIAGSANRISQGFDISGTYTIVNDADSTYTTVMPSQHAAMVMQNPSLLLADGTKPSVDINTSTQAVEDLGAGDKILGHATHHYRMKTSGRITMTMSGGACTHSTDGETEVWIAPDVDMGPAMLSMASHYGNSLPEVTGNTSSSLPIKGVALRSKTRHKAVLPNGESRVIETTAEFVELSNAPLSSSLFTVPADFQVMDMRKQMAKMVARGDMPAPAPRVCPN